MHIHGGHLNPNSLGTAETSSSTLAARRAAENRKKLFDASSGLDATASTEGAWMITAWAGGNASSTADHASSSESGASESDTNEEREGVQRSPATGPVSYWA